MLLAKNEQYKINDQLINNISEEIIGAYLSDDRPWVVGFSGGKDSTALLQIIYYSLVRLPENERKKHIYVITSETRVEMPHISKRNLTELELISISAEQDNMPISTHIVFPKSNDTFWVNLIGRGYPSPNSRFRWCTDRLKIHQVSEFIRNVINKSGSTIVVLGTRRDESATSAQSHVKNEIKGNRFRPHIDLLNAYVFTPIEEMTSNDVWSYLLNIPSPWNGDNKGLVELYKQASGEYPLIIDKSTPSCGHSRFGCWTCTVVKKDRSLESLIFSGDKNLIPLLELRDYLREIRNERGTRYDHRRNGTIPKRRGTEEIMNNTGPFTHAIRRKILKNLLEAQSDDPHISELINENKVLSERIGANEEEKKSIKADIQRLEADLATRSRQIEERLSQRAKTSQAKRVIKLAQKARVSLDDFIKKLAPEKLELLKQCMHEMYRKLQKPEDPIKFLDIDPHTWEVI